MAVVRIVGHSCQAEVVDIHPAADIVLAVDIDLAVDIAGLEVVVVELDCILPAVAARTAAAHIAAGGSAIVRD